MTLKEFQNIEITLPPYFVVDDTRCHEDRYSLSYHFQSGKRIISIMFNKYFNKEKIDVWTKDLNRPDEDNFKFILGKKISANNLNKIIEKINI